MDSNTLEIAIGWDLPPMAQSLFLPHYDEASRSRTARKSQFIDAMARPIKGMEIDRAPYARFDDSSRQSVYIVATGWDAQTKGRKNTLRWFENWRSNFPSALEAAIAAGAEPLNGWMESPDRATGNPVWW